MARYAALDVGSNSVLIYITEKEQWIITDEEIAKKILNRKYISELVSDRANAKVSLTILPLSSYS